MSLNELSQEAIREKALAELHHLLERTATPLLHAYLPVVREFADATGCPAPIRLTRERAQISSPPSSPTRAGKRARTRR